MNDIGKFIGLFILLGFLWVYSRLDEIFLWLEVHKIQILSGVFTLLAILVLIKWRQYKKKKALMIKEKERAQQLKRIKEQKMKEWRGEDMTQAINVSIKSIDKWHRQRLSTKKIGDLFESRMAAHFRLDNYQVQEMGGSGDGGVDLILISEIGKKIIVQCKCYDYKVKVTPDDVSRTFSAIHLSEADEGWIITDSTLTAQAKEEARKLGIIFWERTRLTVELDNKRKEVLTKMCSTVPATHTIQTQFQ